MFLNKTKKIQLNERNQFNISEIGVDFTFSSVKWRIE